MELDDIIKSVQNKWGRETVNAILRKIDEQSIEWQGTLRRSISYEQTESGDISFFMADYGQFSDEGVNGINVNRGSKFNFRITSIGGVAYHIKPWADSKGLNNWAVARSIVRKGIKPRPFFSSVIESRLESLGVDIEQSVVKYMEDQISNFNSGR